MFNPALKLKPQRLILLFIEKTNHGSSFFDFKFSVV